MQTIKKTSECIDDEPSEKSIGHKKNPSKGKSNEEPFKCNICQKTFNAKGHFTRHLKMHAGEKPFICDTCQKKFRHKCDLLNHMRLHTSKKSFKCDICQKKYPYRYSLSRHLKVHQGKNPIVWEDEEHTISPYQCEICQKKFLYRGDLNKHIRVHTGEKKFKCHICKKYFKGHLPRHVRLVHTAERFKCSHCPCKFLSKELLDRHIDRHERAVHKQPFGCGNCSRRFLTKNNLIKHIQVIHSEKKSFQCTICSKRFKLHSFLDRHNNKMHKVSSGNNLAQDSSQKPVVVDSSYQTSTAVNSSGRYQFHDKMEDKVSVNDISCPDIVKLENGMDNFSSVKTPIKAECKIELEYHELQFMDLQRSVKIEKEDLTE